MEEKKDNGSDNIDNSLILPSFIDEKYLKQKFTEETKNEQEKIVNKKMKK